MYQRTLGAVPVTRLPGGVATPASVLAKAHNLTATGGTGGAITILLVGGVAGAAFLLWRKFRKKG